MVLLVLLLRYSNILRKIGWIRPCLSNRPRQTASAARNWTNSVPQTDDLCLVTNSLLLLYTVPYTMTHHTVPCTMSPHTVPYTMSPHTATCTMSPDTVPYTMSPHTVPYTMSHHTVPCTMSHHTVPYTKNWEN